MTSIYTAIKNLKSNQWSYNGILEKMPSDFSDSQEHKEFIKNYLTKYYKDFICTSTFNIDKFNRSIHTNIVFFLGCILYERFIFKDKINIERNDKDSFLIVWLLSSLTHDFAYILEEDTDNNYKEEIKCLSDFIKEFKIEYDLLIESTNSDLSIIPKYFEDCLKGKKSRRNKKKIDHGIAAGIILYNALKTNRVEQHQNKPKFWKQYLDKFYLNASEMICLHNIRREDNKKYSFKEEPFMLLFAIADTIEPTKTFDCISDTNYILKNILLSFNNEEKTITIQNASKSKLNFSKLQEKVKGLDKWLDIIIDTTCQNKIYIKIN